MTIDDQSQLKSLLVLEYNKEFYGEGQMFYAYKRMAIEDIFYALEKGSAGTYVIPLPKGETI